MSGESKEEKEGAEGEEEKPEAASVEAEAKGEIVEERIYTVPLSRAWIAPVTKRAPRAMRILKVFIRKHMKADDNSIRILNEVNERIWSRGIEKPPRKIRVRAAKDRDGLVTVHLAEGE